ncbi:MAG: hypothetical protein HGA65_15845, partial [Oscillochloris sp.]|nr:hypothetical protein [Oscillochloris sp.]
MLSKIRYVLLLLVAALFVACSSARQADLPGWQELYRREGWQGGSALDLRAVGDVMLARHVGDLAARVGPDVPFAQFGDLLAGDLA